MDINLSPTEINTILDALEALEGYDYYRMELVAKLDDALKVIAGEKECPECGSAHVWSNSSDELQCDNCGYSETE